MVLENALDELGKNAVQKYRQSFTDNDRVATGKTNQSVDYEVTKSEGSITLSVFGRKDINQLEEGVTAEQYSSNPSSFSDLEQWIDARGLNRTALSIDRGLKLSGWSTEGKNRTGINGGTKDIITTPSNQIIEEAKNKVEQVSRDLIVKQIEINI